MSNATEHHHHSRLFYFLTNPTQNNPPVLSSTAPIAVAIQDCCRLCCPTPQPTTLSEPVRCKWSSCPESFNQPEDLTPHLFRDHVNKNRKRQPKCYWESCSETVEDLVKHLTSRHLMRLWLACRWRDCSQSFDGFKPLTDHVSKDHVGSGKSEYECDWTACDRRGRVFNQRQKIMRHIQTHTGARPYQCDVCQRRFSESNVMIQHRRVHTGEKPFGCEECPKTFAVSASLKIHKRVHTGEKPFACRYQDCNKRFVESSNLTKHMRVHTGERPFKCTADLCEKAFSRPDQVTRHLKTHQKIPPSNKTS